MAQTPLDLSIDVTDRNERRLSLTVGDGESFEAVAHRDTFESTWTSRLTELSFVEATCTYVANRDLEVYFVNSEGPPVRMASGEIREGARCNPTAQWVRINDVNQSLTWISPAPGEVALCNLIGDGYDRWHMHAILEATASLELKEQLDLLMTALDGFPGQNADTEADPSPKKK